MGPKPHRNANDPDHAGDRFPGNGSRFLATIRNTVCDGRYADRAGEEFTTEEPGADE